MSAAPFSTPMNTKKLILLFTPAFLIAGLFLFIQVIRYEPLFPDQENLPEEKPIEVIPVFPDDIIIGAKRPTATVIAFEDFSCPACRRQNELLTELLAKYPEKIKIVWKGLPVGRFPYSTELAQKYSYCTARENEFVKFKQLAFANADNLSEATLAEIVKAVGLSPDELASCVNSPAADSHISRVKQLAAVLNIQSVPAFFVNNRQIEAPPSVEAWVDELGLKI
ncbi:MAG: DSBA oxidoreductase [Candidatus Magasanikbacteria bacterium GW2011_GWA2_56_11]|uniref:DSBA oxidoreductase n=1 Tax=Candidatus Magasanikbacteria bacterium GW2011_GWA2_56_11 TaxID=1619044 RepID=A0A0G2AJR3_9BACT|nr:MAG: DSBA oxidoreductase [Candidatus Magasanikbacteria bacterium GW2011_GWA2_56_11]